MTLDSQYTAINRYGFFPIYENDTTIIVLDPLGNIAHVYKKITDLNGNIMDISIISKDIEICQIDIFLKKIFNIKT